MDLSFNSDVKVSTPTPINMLPNSELTFFLQYKFNLVLILCLYDMCSCNQAWFEY